MEQYNPDGKVAGLGVQALSSYLLFAQAATECGSDCCVDGWTCQEGHCVCLTGPQCGYYCCPAGLGCLNGPFGPGCVAPGEGCSGPVCNDYMA